MCMSDSIEKTPVAAPIGVTESGRRLALGLRAGDRESASNWRQFFKDLKMLGVDSTKVTPGIMDGLPGLEKVFQEELPKARFQRRQFRIATNVPKRHSKFKQAAGGDLRFIFYASCREKSMALFTQFKTNWEAQLPSALCVNITETPCTESIRVEGGEGKAMQRNPNVEEWPSFFERDPEVLEGAVRRRFSAACELHILKQADFCTELQSLGALLRGEGLYASNLRTWRRHRDEERRSAVVGEVREAAAQLPNQVEESQSISEIDSLDGTWDETGDLIEVDARDEAEMTMITLLEAINYRCLRSVSTRLGPFHVLVGPNASGKTTFLDVIAFLRDVASEGLDAALSNRTTNPEELLYRRQGDKLELAIETLIPDEKRSLTARPDLDRARYEVVIGFDETKRQFELKAEKFLLKKSSPMEPRQRTLSPMSQEGPDSLVTPKGGRGIKVVVNKVPGGNDNFYSETYSKSGKGWTPSFKLGPQRSALGNLPADESSFPIAVWFRELLTSGVQRFILNSLKIKQPSPPTKVKGFLPDGSNLPWVVARLRREDDESYHNWIAHLQTSLADLVGITTFERPEDKHCYLIYEYEGGLKIPSWLVSDGTLRLTALTLPAYLSGLQGVYLIEEPENGIHPRAVATLYDSLSSVYAAQVLLATHSPVVLNAAKIEHVFCFEKDKSGSTSIKLGSEHPIVRKWQGEVNLGTLLAAGVLG